MEDYERVERKIARLIGEPINTQLPVALELTEIADVFTAKAGEHVWRIKNLDKTADVILQVNSDGKIIVIKSPLSNSSNKISKFDFIKRR